MKVQKRIDVSDPGYPNRQQFFKYGQILAGVAVIGLGAVAGCSGKDVRKPGSLAVDPRTLVRPGQPSVRGGIRAEPLTSRISTNLPVAATNQPPATATSTL